MYLKLRQMSKSSLTDLAVKALKPEAREYWKACGNSLLIRVRPSGDKVWWVRKLHHGNLINRKVGDYPSMSLRDARREVENALAPGAAVKVGALGAFLNEWYASEIETKYRRPKHIRHYIDRLPTALVATPLENVTLREVFKYLKGYAKPDPKHGKRGGPVAANRMLSVLKLGLNWAVIAGYIPENPLDKLTAKSIGGKEKPRERVLTDEEIKKVWYADTNHTALLRFLLLTGQRIGEAQRATWAHFDLNKSRWSIPAEHSKNKAPHWVALSPAAKAIIEAQPKGRATVFGMTNDTAVQASLRRWCEREGIDPAFTPHDLRRTFSTRCNEIGIPMHVVEKILNHALLGVLGIYNRAEHAEARETAMTTWADALAKIVEAP
ncbi:MAG: tyrosine-type recombinase/integrase [Steroidobacteraceae bacterium]